MCRANDFGPWCEDGKMGMAVPIFWGLFGGFWGRMSHMKLTSRTGGRRQIEKAVQQKGMIHLGKFTF